MKRLEKYLFSYLFLMRLGTCAVFFMIVLCSMVSCKKNNSGTAPQGETFFKLYDVTICKNVKTTNSTISCSGSLACDMSGNIYSWYFDSIISGTQRIAIIKTDANGNKIWSKSYMPFFPAHYDLDLVNNNYTWPCFACIGQNLFLCGSDPTRTYWSLLKINCGDGSLTDSIPITGIGPNSGAVLVQNMLATKEGDLLICVFCGNSAGGPKPALALYDQSGNQIWVNNNIPYPIFDSGNYVENPYCLQELSNGNFILGGEGMHNYSNASGASLSSSILYFHNISNTGQYIGTDSLAQGVFNSSGGDTTFYNSNGASQMFALFPSIMGGYVIISTEIYDLNTDMRVKILKTDAAFHVTDSSYIGYGSSFVSATAQDNNGDIFISVFSQILPLPNAICDLYKIAPNGSIASQKQIGLSLESVYASGMCPTNDGHIVMSGLIQLSNVDTNNLFILKTDNNINY